MKKRNYPFEIACAVDQFLDEDGCPYSFDEENGCFKFDMIMPLAGKARDNVSNENHSFTLGSLQVTLQ